MKVVEGELEKTLNAIVSVDERQFGFMPERGAIDAVFILRRLLEEYHAKEIRFCGPGDSFWQSTKESVGMCIEEERNTRSFG